MRTAAILPVKRFAAAKSRLNASVAGALRERLALAMVGDVMLALSRTPSIAATIVVTREPTLLELDGEPAAGQRLLFVYDEHERGQSHAVALGVKRAQEEGIERVLCIPGDCPALDPSELGTLLECKLPAAGEALAVIVPDRHGTGTNGLLLSPPDAIPPSFGPGSCARHRELARRAGVSCRVERPSTLLLDVDTGEDLATLRARLAGADTRLQAPPAASGTRGLLEEAPAPSYSGAGRAGA